MLGVSRFPLLLPSIVSSTQIKSWIILYILWSPFYSPWTWWAFTLSSTFLRLRSLLKITSPGSFQTLMLSPNTSGFVKCAQTQISASLAMSLINFPKDIGVPIGSPLNSLLGELFMHWLGKEVFKSNHINLAYIIHWHRNKDDVLYLWTGSVTAYDDFLISKMTD